jgi:hypothetical protein
MSMSEHNMSTSEAVAKDNDSTTVVDGDEEIDVQRLLQLAKVKIEKIEGSPLSLTNISKLDLSNCNLSTLPAGLPEAVPNLSVLFLSKNRFREMPAVIGQCSKLQMIAFKDNGMESIHPDALQSQLRWLILTDNKLRTLPEEIGRCSLLQKLMLSGNQLEQLPESIAKCTKLELIRLATNQLREPPTSLLQLPSLAWVALSDNPFLAHLNVRAESSLGFAQLNLEPLTLLEGVDELEGDELGRGAGGVTRRVDWNGQTVAVKTYNGVITSDGLPEQERLISCAASALMCDCLITVLGETGSGSLVMEYLHQFSPLAGPPSFDTCSRDVYPNDGSSQLIWDHAETLVSGLLDALTKLHAVGICHGDFYGHNILCSDDDATKVKLSDFGAAFFYDRQSHYGSMLETVELRAFAILVEEVHALLIDEGHVLKELALTCRAEATTFDKVHIWWKQRQLAGLAKAFGADAF